MKIKTVVLSVLCVALMLLMAGCGCQSSDVSGSGASFKGIVTDMDDNTITVKPNKDQPEASKCEEFIVNTNIDSSKKPSALSPGKSVYVFYDGVIEGGNPAKISGVYEINFIDLEGKIVENK